MPARGAPAWSKPNTIEKLWPLARAISRPTHQQLATERWANKHRAEQRAEFDGNRDDPFDGLLVAHARR
jgi:hypothetical protein